MTPDDFSTPNPAYWDNVEAIVTAARTHGMAVLLAYNYLGYGGYGEQGWWKVIQEPQNTRSVMRAFGRSLAQRFAAQSNVIWYPFGDFSPPPGEGQERVRASIQGIQEVLPDAVFAAELNSPSDIVTDNAVADELLNADSFYGYGPGRASRRGVPHGRPCVGIDARAPGVGRRAAVRGSGHRRIRGSDGCAPGRVLLRARGRDGRPDLRRHQCLQLRAAVRRSCPRLAPCAGPARRGRHGSAIPSLDIAALVAARPIRRRRTTFYGVDIVAEGQADGLEHIAAAGTTDDTTVVAYVPRGRWHRTFSIDLSRLPTTATAVWLDPTTGVEFAIPGVAGGGTRSVTTPGFNASGASDWILLARA